MGERVTVDEMLAEARAGLRRLSPDEAADAMAEGAVLIDVRTDDQRRTGGTVPGGLTIALNHLEWRADPASAWRDERIGGLDAWLIVLCEQGYCSSLAAARLQRLGFTRATDVVGGFDAWRAAGLPVDATTA